MSKLITLFLALVCLFGLSAAQTASFPYASLPTTGVSSTKVSSCFIWHDVGQLAPSSGNTNLVLQSTFGTKSASYGVVVTIATGSGSSWSFKAGVTPQTLTVAQGTVSTNLAALKIGNGDALVICPQAASGFYPLVGSTGTYYTFTKPTTITGGNAVPTQTAQTGSPAFLITYDTAADQTAPVFTPSSISDVTAEATSSAGASVTYTAPTAFDDGDAAATTVSCAPVSGSVFAIKTTVVTCSSTDATGNTATLLFNVIVKDTTVPTFNNVPADITQSARAATGNSVTYTAPTASDIAPTAPAVTCSPASRSTFPVGTTTVTCTATDAAGNKGTASFKVNIIDDVAPSFTSSSVPKNLNQQANTLGGFVYTYSTPVATDNTDPNPAVSCDPVSGTLFPVGNSPITCTATDSTGNSASATWTLSVSDNTAPVFEPASLLTQTFTSNPVNYELPTAADVVDGPVTPTCTPASGSTFAYGTNTVSCEAVDNAGNTRAATFTVQLNDIEAPVIETHANETVEAVDASGAANTYTAPSATDNVDSSVTVTCVPAPDSLLPLGDNTITCDASDTAGNAATTVWFIVSVVDTTGPSISSNDVVVAAIDASGAPANFSLSYSDSVATSEQLDASLSCLADSTAVVSGDVFPVGSTSVTCTVSDTYGSSSSTTFIVAVIDQTPPVISDPGAQTVEATSSLGAANAFTAPSASDNVDSSITVYCVPAPDSTLPLGDNTITCDASDAAGNSATTVTFTVAVTDTTAPTISVIGTTTYEATSSAGATVSWTASASDAVDGSTTVEADYTSGSTFSIGTTDVIFSTTDSNGNTATKTVTYTVQDTTAPVWQNLPTGLTINGNDATVVTWNENADDVVDGVVAGKCSPASGTTFPAGTTKVSCTVTDAHDNTRTGSFVVKVAAGTPGASCKLTLPTGYALGTCSRKLTLASGASCAFSLVANAWYTSDQTTTPLTLSCLNGLLTPPNYPAVERFQCTLPTTYPKQVNVAATTSAGGCTTQKVVAFKSQCTVQVFPYAWCNTQPSGQPCDYICNNPSLASGVTGFAPLTFYAPKGKLRSVPQPNFVQKNKNKAEN